MRIPESLESLIEHGIVQDVIRPLMSGKEAQVYLVVSEGEERVAKVYKEANDRSFKNRAEYTEGRKVRNTRDQRAMAKRSRHGRAKDEAAWRSTEVDMIYRLRHAGVRVPTPYHFVDGVLIMEMIKATNGMPAPRLGDLVLSASDATAVFDRLLSEVVRMLATGVVHGDLSDFNVLVGSDGPVIIDFPQSVDASSNQNARKLLLRDVDNLYRFAERFVPGRRAQHYAEEMWQLYERGELTANTVLTGKYSAATHSVDADAVVSLIEDAQFDERRRRESLGLSMRGTSEGRDHAAPPATRTSSYAAKKKAAASARGTENAPRSTPNSPRQGQAAGRGPGARPAQHHTGNRRSAGAPGNRAEDAQGRPRGTQPRGAQPRGAQPRAAQPRRDTPVRGVQTRRDAPARGTQPRRDAPVRGANGQQRAAQNRGDAPARQTDGQNSRDPGGGAPTPRRRRRSRFRPGRKPSSD